MATTFATKARKAGSPVVKNTEIGQVFRGLLVKEPEQRDKQKDGKPIVKANGKHVQELVVTCMVLPGTTNPASIGGNSAVPAPGDVVRLILSGGAFSNWIEAQKNFDGPLGTDVVVSTEVTHAQAYQTGASGTAKVGGEITTQAEANKVPRGQTLGFYGTLSLSRASGDDAKLVEDADKIAESLAGEADDASPAVSASASASADEDDFV